MGNNFNITILYDDKEICLLENDNPRFDDFVNFVSNQEGFDENKLKLICNEDNFDKEDLLIALKESVKDFKKNIEIDKELYNKVIENLNND